MQKETILKFHNHGINDTNSKFAAEDKHAYLMSNLCDQNEMVKDESKNIPKEVGDCYSFSNYLLDPNSRRFGTII